MDEIACISVNDPFVMAAWGQRDGIQDITMLADGNGAFSDAVGPVVRRQSSSGWASARSVIR